MSDGVQAIECALIVGAGWVGRQVAARFAQAGLHVVLTDKSPDVSQDAIDWLGRLDLGEVQAGAGLRTAMEHGGLHHTLDASDRDPREEVVRSPPWLSRVRAVEDAVDCLSDGGPPPQLVLECVPELISLKKRTLRTLSRDFQPPILLASNSSYFVPSVLAAFVESPQRFAHLHFHVPVLRDSVADIVGCPMTSPQTIESLNQMVHRIGIEPLVLRNEHPGYIFNWLLQSMLKSALQLVASDVADPEMIDKSWKSVTGMPLGPFGIMDQIGLDVIEQVLSNSRWAPPPEVDTEQLLALIKAKTQVGQLGTKTRQGFYDYREPPAA